MNKILEVILITVAVSFGILILVGLIAHVNNLSLANTASLGDIFGGFIGPVLSLASFALVSYTLDAQLSANRHEKDKTRREIALRACEQAIKAAGEELKSQIGNLTDCRDKIYRYDESIQQGHNLYGLDPGQQKIDLDQSLSFVDSHLTVAAGLLAIAYKTIQSDDLSEEDKSYCFVLYDNECVKTIPVVVPMQSLPSTLDHKLARNANYIFWLRIQFHLKRTLFYSQVMARENKDAKNVFE